MALSSQSIPSFQEMQSDPGAALSKGWSFLSTAIAGASKAVNENIIQPGMQTVRENAPGVQEKVGVFAATAQKRMGELGGTVKDRTGVDVADSWGSLVDRVRSLNTNGPVAPKGYQGVSDGWNEYHDEEESALYRDEPEGEEFFTQFEGQSSSTTSPVSPSKKAADNGHKKPDQHVEKEGWDNWNEF